MGTTTARADQSLGWHAVDLFGHDLASGAPPRPPGAPSPAAALANAPSATWPAVVVDGDGRRTTFADAVGTGGQAVARLLDRLLAPATAVTEADLVVWANATPAGQLELELDVVSLADGVERSASVPPHWLAEVEARRSAPRQMLVDEGRSTELEAALHVAMLLATDHLGVGVGADDVEGRIAAGARLWLLGGAVAWSLTGPRAHPFRPWADLVTAGLWPIGPVDDRLVVAAATVP